MADVKISALPAVAAAATTDIFAIVQGGVTYKASLTQVIAAIPDATGSTRGLLSAADWTTFNSKQSALTFSTGLTNAAGTVTGNLSTGVAGGQSVIGGTAASNNLTLSSTSNATKGKILFGTSAYDEANNRLEITTTAIAGTRETLMVAKVSDNVNDQFGIGNATATDNRFAPTFYGYGNGTYASFIFRSLILSGNDSGSEPMMSFLAARTDSSTDPNNGNFTNIVTKPLFRWVNGNTVQMLMFATGNLFIGSTPTDSGFRLDVNGTARIQERLTVSQDNTVATQVVSVINTDTANCGMVIAPSGTGAIIAAIPDGTATGGNARGTNAVDLQTSRSNANQVAGGIGSFLGGGSGNRIIALGTNGQVLCGGSSNVCDDTLTTVCGGISNNSGVYGAFIGGGENNSSFSRSSSISGGVYGYAYLYAQRANASGRFAAAGDAQTSAITYRRSITGTAQSELFLDGASVRAILNIASPGPTNGRAWRGQIDLVAIVQTVGNGTVVLGECFMGSYQVGIKRIGTATSLVGTVNTVNTVSDTNMSTAVVTIDADDTNESLRIQFTPPTAAGSTTVIRVVATAYLTEVGY